MVKRIIRSEIEHFILYWLLAGITLPTLFGIWSLASGHHSSWLELPRDITILAGIFWGTSFFEIWYWAWRKKVDFYDMWEGMRRYRIDRHSRPFRRMSQSDFRRRLEFERFADRERSKRLAELRAQDDAFKSQVH